MSNFCVKDGKIHNKVLGIDYNNFVIVLDISVGTVLKFGELDIIKDWYDIAVKAERETNIDGFSDDLLLVDMKHVESKIGVDNACTFVNYMYGSSDNVKKVSMMSTLDSSELSAYLSKLREEFGF